MCGINGFITEKISTDEGVAVVKRMNKALAHRGPDSEGVYSNDTVTLGHRRLSIIDLSPLCNQPFFSNDNRYVIVYNGELYNYRELKLELQRSQQGSAEVPYFFKTSSDTEVVLAAFIRWGTGCLQRFNGMYAFAIHDKDTNRIFIARDRIGVKPLYYSYDDHGFLFSSEIRAILRSGVRKFSVNREVLAEYTMYQTVYAPNTIVKGIKVLMPGHYLEYENGKLSVTEYYNLKKINPAPEELSYDEVCGKVNELLTLSVQRRLVADVPFGAFLSGGIDSSIVVGLMSEVSSQKVQTFNISFDESEFSESKYANLIARRFNTQHHEIKLTPADFLKDLPEALAALDHPGGDGPNTFIVAKATKEAGITMALSGVGGDELFAGYDVFRRMIELQKRSWINAVPHFLRTGAGKLISGAKRDVGGDKIAELLSQEKIDFQSTYPLTRSLFTGSELKKIISGDPFENIKRIIATIPQHKNYLISAITLAETSSYLQNVLLRDADQMGMAVALEIREPFLDYLLIEFVLKLNDRQKFPLTPKKLLVDSVGDLLPANIVNRPKMGFTLPWQLWMKNELRSFCERNIELLEKRSLFVDGAPTQLWSRFLKSDPKVKWSRVWSLVVLNKWLIDNNLES